MSARVSSDVPATTSSARYAKIGPSGRRSRSRTASGRRPARTGMPRPRAGPPPASRRSPRGSVSRRRRAGPVSCAVAVEEDVEQRPDLLDGERERRPADVDDLALAAKPLDRERHLGPRRHDDSGGSAGARRTRASTNRSEPVAPARTWRSSRTRTRSSVERRLERVGHERRSGRCLGHDRRVVGRLDRALDGAPEVRGDRRQSQSERRGDTGGKRAHVAVGCVERVPGRRAGGCDPGRERRLSVAGSARRRSSGAAPCPSRRCCSRTGRASVPIGSAGGSSLADRPLPARAISPRPSPPVPGVDLVRCAGDGVGVGGHRVPLRQAANGKRPQPRVEPWTPDRWAYQRLTHPDAPHWRVR